MNTDRAVESFSIRAQKCGGSLKLEIGTEVKVSVFVRCVCFKLGEITACLMLEKIQ